MSDEHPTMPTPPGHRPASVTLRQGQEADAGALLDPANQSLAEALRITFWILQLAMLVIFGLFLLSGFQTVRENESAIRLLFGRVTSEEPLRPGFQFSWPYPIGELIKVGTGAVQVEVDEAFWPGLTSEQRRLSLMELAPQGKQQLKPGMDGSLLTADRALTHTKWSVLYTRAEPAPYAQTILNAEEEAKIVRAAVQRGVVQAVANTTIDDLLKQSSGDQDSVAGTARQIAQAALDEIGSGLRIDQLTLREKIPPLSVLKSFSDVQSAEQKASQSREKAEGDARNLLNATAGAAAPYLVARIQQFEQAVELNDAPAQERLMQEIQALLDGSPVQEGDRTLENLASGRVASILNEARQYQTSVVGTRRAEAALFQAKLEQFRLNPRVVVQRDWSDALATILARDNVEAYMLPPGMNRLEVLLNSDPTVRKAMEAARKLRQNLEMERERERKRLEDIYKTDTGMTVNTQ